MMRGREVVRRGTRSGGRAGGTARALLAAVLVVGFVPADAAAQSWAAWDLYWENDSYAMFGRSDARYTNGLRLDLTAPALWPLTERIQERWFPEYEDATNSLVIGQNQFTPNLITSFAEDTRDRPFAGFLFAGVRLDMTQEIEDDAEGWFSTFQHSFEVTGGVLGPLAGAGVAQGAVHVLRENRLPKGWRHQIGTEPALHLGYDFTASLRNGLVDLVPSVGATVGNVQTVGRVGATLRIGTVRSFPSRSIGYSAMGNRESRDSGDEFRWAVFAGADVRGFLHNAYVEGPMFGEATTLVENDVVPEWRMGVMLRAKNWSLNWTRVARRPEFETPAALGVGDGRHNYGSISIGRYIENQPTSRKVAPNPGETPRSPLPWGLRNWILDVGMGVAASHDEGGPREGGLAMRVAVWKGLNEHILVGGEISGAAREADRAIAGIHRDRFYIVEAAQLGWRPWGRRHFVMLRGGVGRSIAHIQEIEIQGFEEVRRDDSRTERRIGALFGASAALPVGDRVSFGVDLNLGKIYSGSEVASIPAGFSSWTFGLKWHP